jgi:hypothetical protein
MGIIAVEDIHGISSLLEHHRQGWPRPGTEIKAMRSLGYDRLQWPGEAGQKCAIVCIQRTVPVIVVSGFFVIVVKMIYRWYINQQTTGTTDNIP